MLGCWSAVAQLVEEIGPVEVEREQVGFEVPVPRSGVVRVRFRSRGFEVFDGPAEQLARRLVSVSRPVREEIDLLLRVFEVRRREQPLQLRVAVLARVEYGSEDVDVHLRHPLGERGELRGDLVGVRPRVEVRRPLVDEHELRAVPVFDTGDREVVRARDHEVRPGPGA